jgi:hypothetical protein
MKLHEIHDRDPLVWVLLQKLLAKQNHVCLVVANPTNGNAYGGWITDAVFDDGAGDYEIHYQELADGANRMYFTIASRLETFTLEKDSDDEHAWYLVGKLEMPRKPRKVKEDVADEEPLIVTLLRQLQDKGEPIFVQRTRGTARTNNQAIYPIVSFRWNDAKSELTLNIQERYAVLGPGKNEVRYGIRPGTVQILNGGGDKPTIDERWTLSKTKHGMVLHVADTPVSDRLDAEA